MTQAIPTAGLGRTGLKVTRLGFGTAISGNHDDEQLGRIASPTRSLPPHIGQLPHPIC